MDKNAIKKYAVWARRELIEKVSQKAMQFGIEQGKSFDSNLESINGRLLTESEKKQRQALIDKVNTLGYSQVMEEVAFTWFNRFIALRFMEVNGYLPSHIRVFTDENNDLKPQVLSEALHLEFKYLEANKVLEMKQNHQDDELFKYLIIAQCNELNDILPLIFQKIEDYTELLLPDYLLREGSVIEQLISQIDQENFDISTQVGQVEIIGWLYQYYNTDQNELVYDGTLSKSRIPKELVSAATTIYTPDWAVRNMVENSLGRYCYENSNVNLGNQWKYYLHDELKKTGNTISLEELKCLDPCMGSGHILCYLFDVLIDIYEANGYSSRDAASLIVNNNLWGLDIDERASQMAYFAVMMKGRQYDRRFFTKNPTPHILSIKESNSLNADMIEHFIGSDIELRKNVNQLIKSMEDAKEYGSIVSVNDIDFDLIDKRITEIEEGDTTLYSIMVHNELIPLIEVARVLASKYDVVVTNPPYLGSSRFSEKLNAYVTKEYSDVKSDLAMVMYKQTIDNFVKQNGYVAFITTTSWMYLSSFEKLRRYLLANFYLTSVVEYGTELFDGKVGHNPIVSWVVKKTKDVGNTVGIRLVDYCFSRRDEKESEYFNEDNRFLSNQKEYEKLPGMQIAYWVDEKIINAFNNKTIGEIAKPRQGLATGDNNRFTRLWFELNPEDIKFDAGSRQEALSSGKKWFPYNKGGEFRKWYGNNDYVVNWFNDGEEIRSFKDDKGKLRSRPQNMDCYFTESITWSKISSGTIAFRYKPKGHIFDVAGTSIFSDEKWRYYILGFCNSTVALEIAKVLSPTLNYEVGHIAGFPIVFSEEHEKEITELVKNNIEICKADWDSYETSWDFKSNMLINGHDSLAESLHFIKKVCDERRERLRNNSYRINELFIEIYGLQDVVKPDIDEKDICIRKYDENQLVKEYLSYAVGCIMGRYSLDKEGIVCASNKIDFTNYRKFRPDDDAIVPICDDEYFDDDIVGKVQDFIRHTFGSEKYTENLQLIATALNGSGTPIEKIRNYFYTEFYSDHCAMYSGNVGRRPIYWQFDSGKKNGFKCLVYIHRYQADTVARIRTDYVHEQQARYRTAIEEIENRINNVTGSEKVKLSKKLRNLKQQEEDIHSYEEKVHHIADQMINIDLNDGVRNNYELFKEILAKVK